MADEGAGGISSAAGKGREGPDAPAKPKITKSRNGCITCKAKRLKCDETKPTCLQCKKRNVECGGYKKDFKWKSFEESSFMRSGSRRKGSSGEQSQRTKDASSVASTPATPTNSTYNASFSPATSASASSLMPPSTSTATTSPMQQGQSPMLESFRGSEQGGTLPHHIATNLSPSYPPSDRSGSRSPASAYISSPVPYSGMYDQSLASGPTNAVIQGLSVDIGRPALQPSPFNASQEQSFSGSQVASQNIPGGANRIYPGQTIPIVNVQSHDRTQWQADRGSSQFEYAQSFLTSQSLLADPMQSPGNEATARRLSHANALLNIFINDTCHVITTEHGEENPWCKYMLPMANTCPPLMYAILAFTAFRAASQRPEVKSHGIEYKAEALKLLGRDMASFSPAQALATTIALSIAEVFDASQRLPHNYLAMNRALVRRMLDDVRNGPGSAEELERSSFILNTWLYFDAMSSLTSRTHHFDGSLAHEVLVTTRSWGFSFPTESFMGVAASLFPFIGRVAGLVRVVRNSPANSADVVAEAENLKRLLAKWSPISRESSYGMSMEITNVFKCTAEAFRWATLLLLHQAVPEMTLKPSSQMASRVLKLLASVPSESACIVFQIFPLLMAGCEEDDDQSRVWVMRRWYEIGRRLQVELVSRCIELTQEVWRRRDGISNVSSRGATQRNLPSDRDFSSSKMAIHDQQQMQGLQHVDTGSSGQFASHASDSVFDQALGQHLLAMQTQQPAQPLHAEVLSEEDIIRILSDTMGLDFESTGATSIYRQSPDALDALSFEQTVRGSHNWLGIMDQWGWELWIA